MSDIFELKYEDENVYLFYGDVKLNQVSGDDVNVVSDLGNKQFDEMQKLLKSLKAKA